MTKILLTIMMFLVTTLFIYYLIENIKQLKYKIVLKNMLKNKILLKLSDNIYEIKNKRLLGKNIKYLTLFTMVIVVLSILIVSFLIFNYFIKVKSTALILAIELAYLPIFFIKYLLNKEKNDIIKILPMYAVNLKNHIQESNNIINAIQKTIVEAPLNKYINRFNINISRGLAIREAFEILKKEVNIKEFDDLVNSCEVCHINGGDFTKVLEKYICIITKENVQRETTKEKAYSAMLTLIVMLILNIFVIISFVFVNKEYASILKETLVGRAILNLNAISYFAIGYFVTKIYKEE